MTQNGVDVRHIDTWKQLKRQPLNKVLKIRLQFTCNGM